MRTKFMHIADCHLGYRQYNLTERFNDFARAFLTVINTAIEEQVDFVLLAGDLFHKRSIDALTLNQAVSVLERLRNAGIPCIAVEGNHEHAYFDEAIGWLQFLNLRQLIVLLNAEFPEGKAELKPYKRPYGSYYEPKEGVRVHGLRYLGAGTSKGVAAYADALAELGHEGVEYSIFMTHAGVEGEVDQMGGLSMREWACLRDHADYIALGHIHKPYERDGWLFNPGSLETCSTAETVWPDRGYYIVEVDTAREDGEKHVAKLHSNRRRPFERISIKTDLIESPEALYQQAHTLMARRARDLGAARLDDATRPIVTVQLQGLLRFDRSALSMQHLEDMAREQLNALHPLIRNDTRSDELGAVAGETMNRQALERHVLDDLFSRDARFAPRSRKWARLALDLKTMTLEGSSSEAILDELDARMTRIEEAAEDDPVENVGAELAAAEVADPDEAEAADTTTHTAA